MGRKLKNIPVRFPMVGSFFAINIRQLLITTITNEIQCL